MSYPYELQIAKWIEAFPLQSIRDYCRRNAEAELRHRKEWFASFSAEEQEKWQLWKPRDEIVPASLQPTFHDVVGPYEMAVIEQMRLELGLVSTVPSAVATDAFVWALGEPEVRHATKVGGLPYRPGGQPWPLIAPDDDSNPKWRKASGQPMTFLAQFCFSGSQDLFPNLPGDVLSIFVEDEQFSRPEAVYLEWQMLGLSKLIAAEDVPTPSWRFVAAYGHRYRTVDFGPVQYHEYDLGSAGVHVRNLGATKIGGIPHYIQSTTEDEQLDRLNGVFLAQLSSLITTDLHFYPWLNHRDPWKDAIADERCLNLVDGGLLYLTLQPDGQVTWAFECH